MVETKTYNEKLDRVIEKYSSYLNKVNKIAYKDIFLISNEVLSRNPYSNIFFDKLWSNSSPKKQLTTLVFKSLLKYYTKSICYLFIWILYKVLSYCIQLKYINNNSSGELIIIDGYIITERVLNNNCYADHYFEGLDDILCKRNKDFAYLPIFYKLYKLSPYRVLKFLRILKKSRFNFITEFELISLNEILHLIKYIIVYPFHLIKFVRDIKLNDSIDWLFRESLYESLRCPTLFSYMRYLMGKKLCRINNNIKLISWCEYQATQKNLYKGMHDSIFPKNKIVIYGCQFFIKPSSFVNLNIPEHEKEFGVTPDFILVNGQYYLSKHSNLQYKIGVSIRYKYLFSLNPLLLESSKCLPSVFLPYSLDDSIHLLKFLQKTSLANQKLFIGYHPSANVNSYKKYLLDKWKILKIPAYKMLPNCQIIIATATGVLVEAVSSGISAIVIIDKESVAANPLISLGKGKIWDLVLDEDEFQGIYNKLLDYRQNNFNSILDLGMQYKKLFFQEPTENRIIELFKL